MRTRREPRQMLVGRRKESRWQEINYPYRVTMGVRPVLSVGLEREGREKNLSGCSWEKGRKRDSQVLGEKGRSTSRRKQVQKKRPTSAPPKKKQQSSLKKWRHTRPSREQKTTNETDPVPRRARKEKKKCATTLPVSRKKRLDGGGAWEGRKSPILAARTYDEGEKKKGGTRQPREGGAPGY